MPNRRRDLSKDEHKRRLARVQQDTAGTLARLTAELEGHLADHAQDSVDFFEYVMHPATGVVVQVGQLRDGQKRVEVRVDEIRPLAFKVPDLEKAVEALQTEARAEREAKQEARRWALRDFLAPTLSAIVAGVLAALLVARFS